MAILSFLPGNYSQGRECFDEQNGTPFKIFHEKYLIYPLFTLSELDDLLEKIKKQDNLNYLIYKYRFKDNLTFAQISERLDLDNPRIAEKLEQIAFSFRIYFGI
jgi:hypothetical protein